MRFDRTTVGGRQINRGNSVAFLTLRGDLETPVATGFERSQACLAPGSGAIEPGPLLGGRRDNRQSGGGVPNFFRHYVDDALGTLESLYAVRAPVDGASPRQEYRLAGFEIRNEQANAAITLDVAQRVEKAIAGKIRKRERTVLVDTEKPRATSTMRRIDSGASAIEQTRRTGCNKKGVGGFNNPANPRSLRLTRRRLAGEGSSRAGARERV